MAVNDHLKWIDFKDFSKGLHTAGSAFAMPPDTFQVMEDCYPQPEGGLRAFFKPNTTAISTSGIVSAANERIAWIQPYVESTGISYVMLTVHATTGQCRGYTRAVGATSWTNTKTFTAHTGGPANGTFVTASTYWNNNATLTTPATSVLVGIGHAKDDGTEDGWWLVYPSTGVWTHAYDGLYASQTVIQHQARMVGVRLNQLWWSDPGTITAPDADNFLLIQSGNNDVRDIITNLIPYSPSSLLVATAGSGWWMVDGDITDPVVRQLGDDHMPWYAQRMVRTESGVVFMEPESGVYLTQNMAASFQRLDAALLPWDADDRQGFGYMNGYLFAPGGRVHHFDSGAWFTMSSLSGSYNAFEQVSPGVNGLTFERAVLIPQYQASGVIYSLPLEERVSARAESYRVKTAPLQKGDGRQAVIREVEVAVKSFHAASTVAVTVNGTTRTSNAIPVGTNVVRFPFKERGEYLDVQVAPASNTSGYEAPIIEEFRVGVRDDGHNVRFL